MRYIRSYHSNYKIKAERETRSLSRMIREGFVNALFEQNLKKIQVICDKVLFMTVIYMIIIVSVTMVMKMMIQ